jgi:thymidine phosphorylase
MQKLIKAQNAIHKRQLDLKNILYLWVVDSENLPLWKYKKEIISEKSGIIKEIDVELLKDVSRRLWAPLDKKAWFYLNKQVWDSVKKWEILCEVFSSDEDRLNQGVEKLGDGGGLFEI